MILGLPLATFTKLHVLISVAGILTGLVVVNFMLQGEQRPRWTAAFLIATILTSVTGFMFPATTITPAAIFGYLSLAVLAVALLALYAFGLRGIWRTVYVVTAILALYLNVFVLIVQAFQKIPQLHRFAPTGGEPIFFVAQALVLACFVAIGVMALRSFHPERAALA